MSSFRGPIALEQVEQTIGAFAEAILANDPIGAAAIPMTEAVGYSWACGCEARGNGSPLCLVHACRLHAEAMSQLAPRTVPARFAGELRLARERVRRVRAGDLVVSAKAEIEAARRVGGPIGYIENGKVIREHADGRREVVASV